LLDGDTNEVGWLNKVRGLPQLVPEGLEHSFLSLRIVGNDGFQFIDVIGNDQTALHIVHTISIRKSRYFDCGILNRYQPAVIE